MAFLPYEDVPLYLAPDGAAGEYIFAESASLSVNNTASNYRQLEDNMIRICAIGDGSSIDYGSSKTFNNAVARYKAVLGPPNGPPCPLATSIEILRKDTEISFPNGKKLYVYEDVIPDGKNYLLPVYSKDVIVLSADEAQQGYIRPLYKHILNAPPVGKLDVNFYINQGNLPTFFDITGLANPTQFPPVNEEKITGFLGDFCFENAYLNSLSFSLSPNSLSQATASFTLYGELKKSSTVSANYYSSSLYNQQSVPHGQESQILGASYFGQNNVTDFSYSITVDRTPRYAAPTYQGSTDAGLIPDRVTKNRTTISMSLSADDIDADLFNSNFHAKRGEVDVELKDLSYDYSKSSDNNNGLLHKFRCNGVILDNSISIQSAGYLNGSINIQQILE